MCLKRNSETVLWNTFTGTCKTGRHRFKSLFKGQLKCLLPFFKGTAGALSVPQKIVRYEQTRDASTGITFTKIICDFTRHRNFPQFCHMCFDLPVFPLPSTPIPSTFCKRARVEKFPEGKVMIALVLTFACKKRRGVAMDNA